MRSLALLLHGHRRLSRHFQLVRQLRHLYRHEPQFPSRSDADADRLVHYGNSFSLAFEPPDRDLLRVCVDHGHSLPRIEQSVLWRHTLVFV